jgi:GDP-4-dehydro-6-deoxy-D-mannose reductase
MNKQLKNISQENISSSYQGKPVLITGANGFVAGYLIPRLTELGAVVHGIDLHEYSKIKGCTYHCCNLLNLNELKTFLAHYRPSFVFHLASQSSVGTSWKHEWQTIEDNTKTTYNLFNALEKTLLQVRLLLVSSIEVYGDHGMRKATVRDQMRPINPYSVSKAMTEMIAHKFQNSAIEYVIARSSNHTGPGRSEKFFEAYVAKQFADAKNAGQDSITLSVGNVDNIRDFSDVRDVVDQYILLASQGKKGNAYNVCSGVGIKLREIIYILEKVSKIKATIEVDSSRLRKNDVAYLVGVNSIRLKKRPISETMNNLYKYFLNQCQLDAL